MEENTQLKPVIFVKGQYGYHRQNLFQQNLLLQAMKLTTDPHELKQMVGLKTVADVYRTLDKMAIRKEYHQALARHGLDLDSIVKGIKDSIDSAWKPETKLKGYGMVLKSIGLGDYKENTDEHKKTWEDLLIEQVGKEKTGEISKYEQEDYEVVIPEIPTEEVKRISEEVKQGKALYE